MKRSNNGNSSWRKFKRTKNGKPRRKNANRNAEESRHPNNENNANKRNHQKNETANQKKKKKGLIQTGNFGSFLEDQEWSDDMLLGQMPATTNDDAPRFADLECIAQFLADYRAMSTLHVHARQSNNNSPTNGSNSSNNNNKNKNNNSTCCHAHAASSTAYYIPVIQDFALTQKDRQSAGLRTNTSRATSEGMTQVVESHTSALEAAMEHVDPFQSTVFEHQLTNDDIRQDDQLVPTEQTLCQWHSVLVANTVASASTNNNSNAKSRTKAVANSTEGGAAAGNMNITTTASIPTAPSFFRKSRAKAGKTIFCPPEDIPKEFQQFRSAMIRYCHQWESKILHLPELRKRSESITSMPVDSAAATQLANQMTQQKHSSIYHALGVAAMYLFGIVDIHMYSDGNGRMSRIGANWMLKRMLGWPFTITLVANPQQRREYISALQHAVNCIQVIRNQQQQKKTPIRLNGSVFRPLILLLLDRMANAVRECQRKLTEKSQLTRAAEEARIARKVREETASGRCVICLDDNPNIATLCCGQGVHLNCVADWLSNNSNCVYCRGPLPQLKLQRPAPPPPEEEPENARGAIVSELQNVLAIPDDNFTAATAAAVSRLSSNAVFLNMIRRSLQDQAIENAEDTTTTFFSSDDDEEEDDVDDAESEDDDQRNDTSMLCVNGICMASTETWCPNGMCSRCCASSGVHCWFHNGRVDTTPADEETVLSDSEDDEEDTTTYYEAEVAENEPPSIQNVGNAAGDNGDTTTFLGSGEDENGQDTTTYNGDDDADDDEDTTPWYPGRQQSQRVMSCTTGDCNNRPAADCQNHMCGRCCVLFGQYSCLRHNTGTYAN